MAERPRPRPRAAAALTLLLALAGRPPGAADDLVERGRRLYRNGVLTSGGALVGVVAGDVPLPAAQVTCAGCHLRSAMGTREAGRMVPPLVAHVLYAPAGPPFTSRPAYTDATLARAVRDGVDAGGRGLDPLMPRYPLADEDMTVLLAYLRSLGPEPSAGVSDDGLRFAVVVSDDAPETARATMLGVLDAFVEERNRGRTRHAFGPVFRAFSPNRPYATWVLERWMLHGAVETWPDQLEASYRERPVFALLSGMAAGSWRPIADFCERHEIPCLLPNTDLPAPDRDAGHYTRYFSRGVGLEAAVLAADVTDTPRQGRIVQIFRRNALGKGGARALRHALRARGQEYPADVALADRRAWPTRLPGAEVAIAWLARDDLAGLANALRATSRVYLSSSFLGGELAAIPDAIRDRASVAHPFALPDDMAAGMGRVETWLRSRGLAPEEKRIAAQTYFACQIAEEGVTHVESYFRRDYFLDQIDHLASIASAPFYPRLTFGAGQRYLAKGCYLLRLRRSDAKVTIEYARWITVG